MSGGAVIIGAGQAGGQAAASLRQCGYIGPVTIIGAEPHPPYQRPPLSKAFLAGGLSAERLFIRPAEFYAANAIALRLGDAVRLIDRGAKEVRTQSGAHVAYDKLLIATGAPPRRLSCPGADLAGVHYLRTIDDSGALRGILSVNGPIVIVGAGYIGLEVAAVARKAGRTVVVLEMADRVLARVAPEPVSDFFATVHRSAGVDLRLGATLEALVERNGAVAGARLTSGETIACVAALVGIGAAPALALAAEAGLEVADGVVVDEHARTSDSDIFAAGDCASFPSTRYGRRMRLESVPNAIEHAKIAAANMAGGALVHDALPWFWSDQYDVKLQSAGLGEGCDQTVVRGDPADGKFSVWRLKDGAALAVDAINDPASFAVARRIIPLRRRVDAWALRDPAYDLKAL